VMPSPLRGAAGNIEFLGHFRVRPPALDRMNRGPGGRSGLAAEELAAAVEEAHR